MKVSICVDAVYMGKDFVESLKEISSIGGKAFEFWTWWDKDLKTIKAVKEELGLEVVAFCTKFVSLVDKGLCTAPRGSRNYLGTRATKCLCRSCRLLSL